MVAIIDADGNVKVEYTYDAWGKILSISGPMADTLGAVNPLTYRGYVYDAETDLYYLESRYYNPAVGRFINGDALVSTGQGMLGNNMFAYCMNNPVNRLDAQGTSSETLQGWGSAMWWLLAIDGPALIGDTIFTLGVIVLGGSALDVLPGTTTVPSTTIVDPKEHEKALSQTKSYAVSISDPDEPYAVHHIVAKSAPLAEPARNVLESVGIDPYSNGLNLAIIPMRSHVSLHTHAYYNYINSRFEGLKDNTFAVVVTLAELQIEIQIYSHLGLKAW